MLWFIVSLAIGLYFAPAVLNWFKHQPDVENISWHVFSLTDGIFVYMKCAFIVGFALTVPLLLYHVWSFVKPGLTEQEKSGIGVYIFGALGLFILGLSFAYFVAFPMMVSFLTSLNISIGASATYGISRYFSFMFSVTFPVALAFEMPVIVLFLTKIRIINPRTLSKARKYAYLALVTIGVMISPPDFISHLCITVPLISLFEISLLLSFLYVKKLNRSLGGKIHA